MDAPPASLAALAAGSTRQVRAAGDLASGAAASTPRFGIAATLSLLKYVAMQHR
jgi:hypothetical protein